MIPLNLGAIMDLARRINGWWRTRSDRCQILLGSLAIVLSSVFVCLMLAITLCATDHKWCIAGNLAPSGNETDDGFPSFQIASNAALHNFSIITKFEKFVSGSSQVANAAFIPKETFITVHAKPDHTESAKSQYNDGDGNIRKRVEKPKYNEHILCLGTRLKTAIDYQDLNFLKESEWSDWSIMYDEKVWTKTPTNGMLTSLSNDPWGESIHRLLHRL